MMQESAITVGEISSFLVYAAYMGINLSGGWDRRDGEGQGTGEVTKIQESAITDGEISSFLVYAAYMGINLSGGREG